MPSKQSQPLCILTYLTFLGLFKLIFQAAYLQSLLKSKVDVLQKHDFAYHVVSLGWLTLFSADIIDPLVLLFR